MPKRKNSDDGSDLKKQKRKARSKANKHIRDFSKKSMQKAAFVGLDVHKKTIQVSVMTDDGTELINKSISNTPGDIKYNLGCLPESAKLVMESSSIWMAPFKQIRDELGLDIILSNPYKTKIIAASKKKTDRVDAKALADLHRGNYIIASHVPSKQAEEGRKLVRSRYTMVRHRIGLKNSIHGILLQESIKPKGTPFSAGWIKQVSQLDDYRISNYLAILDTINEQILKINVRIHHTIKEYEDAQLLKTIPGVGNYTALVVASGIDGIERFPKSHKLCSYFGLVPSVRSSGNVVNHGPITREGSSLVRMVMTEAALSHLRYAPKSGISIFYKRLAKKRGNGKAAVAAASKMLKMMFWMLKERKNFAQLQSGDNLW